MPSKKNEDTKTRGTTESIGALKDSMPDLLSLYEGMLKSRMFEKAVTNLWNEGKILGEMHLSMGEEAIVAGIVGHLTEGDSMALDHRGTAALVMRSVDLTLLLKEFLGRPGGLCRGWGGHMHLFSKAHMAASSGIVGAAVGAAMAGLKPIVEVMLADFLGVAIDALLNHAAKVEAFSGGTWRVPMVVRTACGGGYGDGGQHEQSLWGWLAHIPGLGVVIPSTPADAGGLMLGAIEYGRPVVYMEHKLLTDYWLDYLGTGGRKNVTFDVPQEGAEGIVPDRWEPIPLGKAAVRRRGTDITIAGVGVDVHRALTAAKTLEAKGISVHYFFRGMGLRRRIEYQRGRFSPRFIRSSERHFGQQGVFLSTNASRHW